MVTLLIAVGALLVAVAGCVLVSPNEDHEHLMEDFVQPFL